MRWIWIVVVAGIAGCTPDDSPPSKPKPAAEPATEPAATEQPEAKPAEAGPEAPEEAAAPEPEPAPAELEDTPVPEVRAPKEGGMDMAKTMKDSAQAPWQVQIHDGAAVGQYAITEAGPSRMWWGVTGRKGGRNVIEMRMKISGQGWVTYAYVVDREGVVQEAYVANYDPEQATVEAGYAIQIMAKPEEAAAKGPEPDSGTETINAGGRDWDCKWFETEHGKSWIAEQGWFGGTIRVQDASGKTILQLVETGTDATLGLAFPEKK